MICKQHLWNQFLPNFTYTCKPGEWIIMFLLQLDRIKFPLTYIGKSENWHLLLSHCRYFDKVLQKCSLSSPLPNISVLSRLVNLFGCHGNRKAKFVKKYKTRGPLVLYRSPECWGYVKIRDYWGKEVNKYWSWVIWTKISEWPWPL